MISLVDEEELVTGLLCYLGVSEESRKEVLPLYRSAVQRINRACKVDWRECPDNETFIEAVQVSVWLSFHAVRDNVKNAAFLSEYLTELICTLQLSATKEVPNA